MKEQLKKLTKLSMVYSFGQVSEKALNFLLIPLYTLFLLPEAFGIIGLMAITIELANCLIIPPITNALTRFYYEPNYIKKNKIMVFNLFILLIIKTIIVTAVFIFLNNIIAIKILGSMEYLYIVKWYIFILLLKPTGAFFQSLLRIQERAKYFVTVSILRLIIKGTTIILLLFFFKWGVLSIVVGLLVGEIVNLVTIFPVFYKNIECKFNFKILKEPLKFSYPLLPVSYSSLFIKSGDRYILRIFASLNVVGLYSFGYQFSNIINILIVTPVKNALQPLIFKQERNPKELKKFIKKTSTYYYLFAMFIWLCFSLFGYELMSIMTNKPEYLKSFVIVPIIAFSIILMSMGNFLGQGLIIKKKSIHLSILVTITAIINIVLNFILIPIYGIVGAAFATLISFIISNIFRIYYSNKFYNLTFELKRLLIISILSPLLYSITLLDFFSSNDIFMNILFKIILLVTYPLTFIIFNFFTLNEKKEIVNLIVNIRKYGIKRALENFK